MQLTLLPLAVLAATVTAQWGQQQQPPAPWGQQSPGNYQPNPPPNNQGGSWTYQGSYGSGGGQSQSSEFPNLKQPEIDGWRSCTNQFLQSVNDGISGSRPACNFWECLHVQASRFNRGGLLTGISNVLNPICSATNIAGSVPILGDFVSPFLLCVVMPVG